MQEFKYKVIGTNDESHNVGIIKAVDKQDAHRKLRFIYGHVNVKITLIEHEEFAILEEQKGSELTHKPEVS